MSALSDVEPASVFWCAMKQADWPKVILIKLVNFEATGNFGDIVTEVDLVSHTIDNFRKFSKKGKR